VLVFNAGTGTEVARLTAHTDYVRDLVWSADSRRLLSVADDQQVIVWSAPALVEASRLKAPTDSWLMSVAMTEDGSRVLTGDNNGWVRLWDMASASELRAFPLGGSENSMRHLRLQTGQQRFTAAFDTFELLIWDFEGAVMQKIPLTKSE